ncbi:hypothetical protein L1887_48071 [Cichorium endivia]|nr:hypothetical protein L1887_48071 [Cichorium endivia]
MTGKSREIADSRVQLQSTLLLNGLRGLLSVKTDLCDCEPVEGIDLDRPCFTAQLIQKISAAIQVPLSRSPAGQAWPKQSHVHKGRPEPKGGGGAAAAAQGWGLFVDAAAPNPFTCSCVSSWQWTEPRRPGCSSGEASEPQKHGLSVLVLLLLL